MLARSVIAGVVVAVLASCTTGNSSRALDPSPSSTPSARPTAAPPLPRGYIRIADPSGILSLGVPHTWYHAMLDGSDPQLARLTQGKGRTAVRWRSYAKAADEGGVFAAADPLSTDAVLLIEHDTGVDMTDLGRLDRELRSKLGTVGTVRRSTRVTLDGERGLRYLVDYPGNGVVVHEVIDFFDINGTIVDLTFTGGQAAIAAITATVHFRHG